MTTDRRIARALTIVAAALVCLCALPGSRALADGSQVTSFSVTPSTMQAGAHPDVSIDLGFATTTYPNTAGGTSTWPQELARDITVDLPPGLLGNATAFPTCDTTTLVDYANLCPVASQVGTMTLQDTFPESDPNNPGSLLAFGTNVLPVINEPPVGDDVARLGVPFVNGAVVVQIDIRVRDTSDYGLEATISNLPSTLAFFSSDVDLWGVPGSSTHDSQRLPCFDPSSNNFDNTSGPNCPTALPRYDAFMVNPTSCSAPENASAQVSFYGDPQTYAASAPVGTFTGCDALPFDPSVSLAGQTGQVGQPDGLDLDLQVPQASLTDMGGDTTSAVDGVTVQLPAGAALSPSAATGLGACTDAQLGQGSDTPQACPANAQIGTVSIVSPLLSSPLTGEVFVGQQESGDPASGQMYRLFLDAVGDGVDLKLVGDVAADPATGRLTVTFPQNPQVPFSSLQLDLTGGPRAVVAEPPACGTATTSWSLSSYASPAASVSGQSSYPVTGDCGLSSTFTPSLTAGTRSARAGASSPFIFTIGRPDGQEDLAGLPRVTLPPGLVADIASVPRCASTQASCPAASQVGTATITAGPGPEPFALSGQSVYLTGPYDGAPFGLAVVVDAVAGPFDLGTVVVRQRLYVNPRTAQVTIVSDPLPTVLGGVPLHIQSISLDIGRPGFMRSPTSCAAMAVSASVTGAPPGAAATVVGGTSVGYASQTGTTVHLTTPFQMAGCRRLHFSPHLAIALAGAHQTRPGSHPSLTATLTQRPGQANLRSVQVALPLSLALDPGNTEHVCSVAAAARIACPRRTIVGSATARTPILPHPLAGPVYIVQGTRRGPHGTTIRTLPRLLVALRGADGVHIDLGARSSVDSAQRLVTTFRSIPDAAIRRFVLRIAGGRRGILVVTGGQSLCHGPQDGAALETGQNGRTHDVALALRTRACR